MRPPQSFPPKCSLAIDAKIGAVGTPQGPARRSDRTTADMRTLWVAPSGWTPRYVLTSNHLWSWQRGHSRSVHGREGIQKHDCSAWLCQHCLVGCSAPICFYTASILRSFDHQSHTARRTHPQLAYFSVHEVEECMSGPCIRIIQ